MKKHSYFLLALLLASMATEGWAQTIKHDLILTPGYVNDNNHVQWLKASARTKVDGRFHQVPGIMVRFYISSESREHLLGTAVTDHKGESHLFIPPSARGEWVRGAKVSFVAVSAATKEFDSVSSSLDIVKARLKIDTVEGRKILATLTELKDSVWTPVKGVDVKIAVRRMDADLNVGETPAYTTDSLGVATADFKRDSLAGDKEGMLTLVASVDDNDSYGSLSAEKAVAWGARRKYVSSFDERTLFARRGRSPWWFELTAYAIIAGVWSVLLFLALQIRRLRQLGKGLNLVD